MRETFTSGSVGGALGNRCFYPEMHSPLLPFHINHLTERVGIDFAFPTSKEFGG
jgi:hypothetical protein